jgi:hypothetical protein
MAAKTARKTITEQLAPGPRTPPRPPSPAGPRSPGKIRRPDPSQVLLRTPIAESLEVGAEPYRGTPATISPLTADLRRRAATRAATRMQGAPAADAEPGPRAHARPVLDPVAALDDEATAFTATVFTAAHEFDSGEYDVTPPPDLAQPPASFQSAGRMAASVPVAPVAASDPFAARIAELERQLAELRPNVAPEALGVGVGWLTARPIAVDDVDRLWDWIRTEPDRAAAFFGTAPSSALALHQLFHGYAEADRRGSAIARSVDVHGQHAGFAVLAPILAADRVAVAHLYLAPSLRGHLDEIVPALLDEAERALPPGIRVVVYGHAGWNRLLELLGFVAHTLLIRERS